MTERARNISRREFMKRAGNWGLAAVLASVVDISCTEAEQNPRSLDGKPVLGEGIKKYMTDTFGNGRAVILRPETNTGSDIKVDGETVYGQEGFLVEAQPFYGVVYESGAIDEGKFVRIDGNWYGRWYRVNEIPIFVKNSNEELIPVGIARGAFVSGNFLTRVPDKADNLPDEGQ